MAETEFSKNGFDTIRGTSEDDVLFGNGGNDSLIGAEGNDVLVSNDGDGEDSATATSRLQPSVEPSTATIGQPIPTVSTVPIGQSIPSFQGGDAAEILSLQADASGTTANFEQISPTPFTSPVESVEGEFLVKSAAGDDRLTLGDLTATSVRSVRYVAGKGNDFLDASASATPTFARGRGGHDTLIGGKANDTLRGGEGNDVLTGGAGKDTIVGGDGDDRMVWNQGDGSDILRGGAGTDINVINGAEGSEVFSIAGNSEGQAIFRRLTQKSFSVTSEGTEVVEINAGSGDDTLDVNSLGQTEVEHILFASGEGNDVLVGNGADVSISADGGTGDDFLGGGSANDRFNGGVGNDTLAGGAGADQFVFGYGAVFGSDALGVDTIADFTSGEDKIVLNKATFAALHSEAGQPLGVGEFAVVTDAAAVESSEAKIVFLNDAITGSGKLFYNSNGAEAGLGRGAEFAVFDALDATLTAEDFVLEQIQVA